MKGQAMSIVKILPFCCSLFLILSCGSIDSSDLRGESKNPAQDKNAQFFSTISDLEQMRKGVDAQKGKAATAMGKTKGLMSGISTQLAALKRKIDAFPDCLAASQGLYDADSLALKRIGYRLESRLWYMPSQNLSYWMLGERDYDTAVNYLISAQHPGLSEDKKTHYRGQAEHYFGLSKESFVHFESTCNAEVSGLESLSQSVAKGLEDADKAIGLCLFGESEGVEMPPEQFYPSGSSGSSSSGSSGSSGY